MRFNKIVLSPAELESFVSYVNEDFGTKEKCGVLIGPVLGDIGIVTKIYLVENISPTPETEFLMDPAGFHNALLYTHWLTDDAPNSYLGIIHSHPVGTYDPSETDLARIARGETNEGAYLIYSVQQKTIAPVPLYVDENRHLQVLTWLQ